MYINCTVPQPDRPICSLLRRPRAVLGTPFRSTHRGGAGGHSTPFRSRRATAQARRGCVCRCVCVCVLCVIINGPEKHNCARLSPPAHGDGALRICAARGGVGTRTSACLRAPSTSRWSMDGFCFYQSFYSSALINALVFFLRAYALGPRRRRG